MLLSISNFPAMENAEECRSHVKELKFHNKSRSFCLMRAKASLSDKSILTYLHLADSGFFCEKWLFLEWGKAFRSIIPHKIRLRPNLSDMPILIYFHLTNFGFFVAKIVNFGNGKNILVTGIEISQWKSIIPLKIWSKQSLSDKPILIFRHLAD